MHFPNSKHQNKTPYKARERGCGVRSSHTFIGLVVSMATISLISGLLMLWLSVLVSETAKVQIHRTGSRSVVTPTDNESWCDFQLCEYLPDVSKVFAKKEAWLYSISATILVGMAGVLPLLVISVEAGHSLREGVSTDNLNLYLSFAAGGLLGDVFLHLLPEAWAHVHDGDDPHTSHFYIGFWILAGLCGFLTLEKLFGEDKGENNSVKKEKLAKEKVVQNGDICNGHSNLERIQDKTQTETNGHVYNGTAVMNASSQSNTHVRQRQTGKENQESASDGQDSCKPSVTEEHVQVVGYLNLLANSIDNFTHGLALAGSFVVSTKMGMCTTFAILVHEIPHEIGDFAILLKSGFRRWDAAVGQLVTASAGICGAIFGLVAEHAGDSTAWVLPLTSGGFIYIAMVQIIPDLLQETRPSPLVKAKVLLEGRLLLESQP
ncbi:zinc transporter ZIP13-like isoform X2 [Acropora muricata]|uniref:zinc transporter ZIP13-like isoform X2 n=1 Tax=Acropora muricata TaxID=159855 RepID=UPI0034E502E6